MIGFSMWGLNFTGLFSIRFSFREALAYGSLISATDPVSIISAFKDYTTDPNFFQIVFGESILNDAISIVFYDTCISMKNDYITSSLIKAILSFIGNIIGSTALGYIIGFITAVFLRAITGKVRNIEKIEISLMVILPWVSYLIAQVIIMNL
jgi:sodium/hydrogen exchanger 8